MYITQHKLRDSPRPAAVYVGIKIDRLQNEETSWQLEKQVLGVCVCVCSTFAKFHESKMPIQKRFWIKVMAELYKKKISPKHFCFSVFRINKRTSKFIAYLKWDGILSKSCVELCGFATCPDPRPVSKRVNGMINHCSSFLPHNPHGRKQQHWRDSQFTQQ